VSHRPLATVCALTIGDYLLWNWSLNANHDVFALISGLTLPPLAIACVWLLALAAGRLLARRPGSRRARSRRATAAAAAGVPPRPRRPAPSARASVAAAPPAAPRRASASSSSRASRKIAA
jgi:hypothetical protein